MNFGIREKLGRYWAWNVGIQKKEKLGKERTGKEFWEKQDRQQSRKVLETALWKKTVKKMERNLKELKLCED